MLEQETARQLPTPGRRFESFRGLWSPMKVVLQLTYPFILFAALTACDTSKSLDIKKTFAHITASESILDLQSHPAFSGFGQYLLPWDNRAYDKKLLLKDISTLLPYHSHVDTDAVIAPINHLIDEVNVGKIIFYDFYTVQQKQEDPSKENTGLFFFRGRPGAPVAILCPGGGFSYVGSLHEGFPHALQLCNQGYNAFVLKYRVGSQQLATADLAAAISYIFENAEMFEVSTEDYSLWGSSAGARMVASIGSYGTSAFNGDDLPKPGTVVMAYTGHSDYSTGEPPTFVVVGENDGIASPSTMERRVNALRKAGVKVEFHKYKNLGHGFGLGIGTSAEGWIEDAIRFWESNRSE